MSREKLLMFFLLAVVMLSLLACMSTLTMTNQEIYEMMDSVTPTVVYGMAVP